MASVIARGSTEFLPEIAALCRRRDHPMPEFDYFRLHQLEISRLKVAFTAENPGD
jgi:hypothetical protein